MSIPNKILSGKSLSERFLKKIKKQVALMEQKPELAALLIGDNPSSHLYVKLKQKACEQCGIDFHRYLFEGDHPDEKVIECLEFLNNDPETTGIIVQLPLPKGFNTEKIINALDYKKDIDGFHPRNRKNMKKCVYKIMPPLPLAIIELVSSVEKQIKGKNIVVLCNNKILGDPLKCVWQKDNEVTIVTPNGNSRKGQNIVLSARQKGILRQADILIVAIGKAKFIKKEMVKKDAVIIDVGINKVKSQVVGDVDFKDVVEKAKFITPVPGGVGPMTVAMLLKNLVALANI